MGYFINDQIRGIDINEKREYRAFCRKPDVIGDPVGNGMFSGLGKGCRDCPLASVGGMLFAVHDDDNGFYAGFAVMSGNEKGEVPGPVRRSIRNRERIQNRSRIVDGKGTASDLIGIVRVILRGQADTDILSCL